MGEILETSGQVKDKEEGATTNVADMDKKVTQVQGNGLEEPIKFGLVGDSNGMNGPTGGEVDHTKVSNTPKDAVDEWPAPKQIHNFYVVKFRSYEDPKLKAKLDQADKEIQKKNQARYQIIDALREKRSQRSSVISQLKPLTAEDKEFREIIGEKRKEMEPFQAALGKLRTADSAAKSEGLCSSEQELNDHIRSLHFRLHHESNTLSEEKQLLKDIKYLEGTRDKVIANADMKAQLGNSFGKKEDMQGQVKQIGVDLDAVRKDQQVVRAKIKKLEEELKDIDDEISSLEEELVAVNQKKDKAFEILRELRRTQDEVNACFFQNRSLMKNVKDLAAKKDVATLEELCHVEVEKFLSQWCSNKAFRADYERRILSSLDNRQLSRDGRMRNPDEKPIVSEVTPSIVLEPTPIKASVKRPKEDVVPPVQHDTTTQMAQKEETVKSTKETLKSTKAEKKGKVSGLEDSETSGLEKSSKELAAAKELDAAKLKEMKRAEEIEKAKLALERKKKKAEKAEAKAAARAQKEEEKKLKEREKKARKKAGASAAAPVEQAEAEEKSEEPEEPETNKEAVVSTQSKINKEQKGNVRYRTRQKAPDQLTKVILKRKKSQSYYWLWVAASAAASLLVVATFGYYYSVGRN